MQLFNQEPLLFSMLCAIALSLKPSVAVLNQRINVGSAPRDSVFRTVFKVKNTGWMDLSLSPNSYTCGSTFDSFESIVVSPQQSVEISVSVHLHDRTSGDSFTKKFSFITNDPFCKKLEVELFGAIE
jgi:hypothetical protein